ncbi:hypothetical protein L6452_03910 [Arctium lappa]|uniref:Uncharacterized protein n=1 Tax=Arctium lappa TaxID=4217 RepID=A0ACB9FNN9_ARCLA|nr:hypothetical protein L6452_03910 [Arctium lappa]
MEFETSIDFFKSMNKKKMNSEFRFVEEGSQCRFVRKYVPENEDRIRVYVCMYRWRSVTAATAFLPLHASNSLIHHHIHLFNCCIKSPLDRS